MAFGLSYYGLDIVCWLKNQPLFMCKSHEILHHAEKTVAMVILLTIHCYANWTVERSYSTEMLICALAMHY
jgi:hypothetical protein